jgi:hypothetical protein
MEADVLPSLTSLTLGTGRRIRITSLASLVLPKGTATQPFSESVQSPTARASCLRVALKRALNRARRLMGRVMRLTFSDGWVGDDLAEYFRRSNCLVVHVGRRKLEVNPQQTLSPELATLEIEGLLRVWRKLHPEASIIASASFGASSATHASRIYRRRP